MALLEEKELFEKLDLEGEARSKRQNWEPWPGGAVRWSIVPYTKGCGFDSRSGCAQKATDRCFSLSLSLTFSASLPL